MKRLILFLSKDPNIIVSYFFLSVQDSKLYLIMTHKDEENILVQDENRPEMCVQCKYMGNALYEASLTGMLLFIEYSLI